MAKQTEIPDLTLELSHEEKNLLHEVLIFHRPKKETVQIYRSLLIKLSHV